jgi:transposase-like protein
MHKHHVTLDCPNCGVDNRAVGDPNTDHNNFHCFNCGANGDFEQKITLHTDGADTTDGGDDQ